MGKDYALSNLVNNPSMEEQEGDDRVNEGHVVGYIPSINAPG